MLSKASKSYQCLFGYTGAMTVLEHGLLSKLLSTVFGVSKREEGLATPQCMSSQPALPCPCPCASQHQRPQQLPWPYLLSLLMEHSGHGEDGAALIQSGRKALPLLV